MTKQNLLLLALLIAGIGVAYAMQSSPPASNQAAQPVVPEAPKDPAPPPPPEPPPPAEVLRPREQIAHGAAMRIHWNLKMPEKDERRLLVDGDYVFRDRRAFADFLGPKGDHLLRWNNLDFSKQMAVVHIFQYPEVHSIDAIIRTGKEIVVLIKVSKLRDPAPGLVRTDAIGVAINHCDLSVRFSFFDEAPAPAGPLSAAYRP